MKNIILLLSTLVFSLGTFSQTKQNKKESFLSISQGTIFQLGLVNFTNNWAYPYLYRLIKVGNISRDFKTPIIRKNNESSIINQHTKNWTKWGDIILEDGSVGIGTINTKGFKLGVKGRIAAEELLIASYSEWADFVFKKDYHLPTLNEVEKHILENGHLKDIPSEDEVKKDGFYVGKMVAKLLQKVEELTLYTIEQEKNIKKTEKENKSLKIKILELQKRLEKLEKN